MASPPRQRRRLNDPSDDEDGYLSDPPPDDQYMSDHNEEDEGMAGDDEGGEPEEEEGEDLMDNMDADYVAIPELDRYDDADLDRRDYGAMDFDQRRAAERALNARDMARGGRVAELLDQYGSEADSDRERRRGRRGPRVQEQQEEEPAEEEDSDDGREEMNLEDFGGVPFREFLNSERVRTEVKRRFKRFLLNYRARNKPKNSRPLHEEKIRTMCAANLASLEVSYLHLVEMPSVATLAIWLADAPRDLLEIMDEVTNQVVLRLFPEYRKIQDEVHVRITELPIVDKLRDLREAHLNSLVRVFGVVTRRSGVFPQLKLVKYNCMHCQHVIGPFKQTDSNVEVRPGSCPGCQAEGPFRLNQEQTVYRNYQKITLQESPGSVPPGRVPRYKDIILLADLIDKARPGEEIEVTGIYTHSYDTSLSQKSGFPVFNTLIQANHIQKKEDLLSAYSLTDDDKADIIRLSREPQIAQRIIQSICPSIYGHHHVKTAIALSLFGGCAKNVNNKHRIRGDINVLLLGDPGTAKSQVLKYCEKTAPRAVYTTGKGASAVGLTAGVHKDPMTKEWTLEGGALVLADKGVCLIDEFDKMNEQDRTSIHEAMEQQSISVSKAGIVTSLQARCAVIAAANPIGGRYDASLTFAENVELTDPILQRFDCLCVLQDLVDPVLDEQLAKFVVGSHRRSHPDMQKSQEAGGEAPPDLPPLINDHEEEPIPQHILRKYIMYARNNVRPQLHNIDQDKVAKVYADLRRESMTSGGVPIAVRHIESIMRMAESYAKMHLRDHVREDDVDVAIATILESFIQAQKFSVRRTLQKGFRKYLNVSSDFFELIMHELQRLVKDALTYQQLRRHAPSDTLEVMCEDLEARAREFNIYNLADFYASKLFTSHNFTLNKQRKVIIKHFD